MPVVRDDLNARGIRLQSYAVSTHKTVCPHCSHSRKNKSDPCLSVTVEDDGAVWNCHNCGWADGVKVKQEHAVYRKKEPIKLPPVNLSPELEIWFEARAIPYMVLERNRVGLERGEIAFPYLKVGEVVNIKYRSLNEKRFRQIKDAEKIYYGLDDLEGCETVIVCEGEIDKLSLEAAGFLNAVSVPDGAPKQVKDEMPDPDADTKFSYVWACKDAFAGVKKIVLATDGDGPGQALAEELARRYGKHRCWKVTWPNINDSPCKDANEVLVQHGAGVLREVIDNAKPYPVKSLYDMGVFESASLRLFRGEHVPAYGTGWPEVDELFKVRPGELTVVTGAPNGGKSQFVDALAVNLAERHGWKFALCSFENSPHRHIANLSELHLDKPFWPGPRERMTETELRKAFEWISGRFFFIRSDDESPTIDWILETAQAAVMRYGIRGLVIDPYNEIEHKRPQGLTETEYVSSMLAKVKRFAQSHGVHVWFIAHPAKPTRLKNGEYAEITLYDISGSSHWVNKADIGIVVVRDYEGENSHPPAYAAEIHVKKIRFKEIGTVGSVKLRFDRATGRYEAAPNLHMAG